MNMYNYLGPYNSRMTPIVLDDSSEIPEYLHQSAHQSQAQPQDQGSTPDESNKTPVSHTFISVAVKVINPAKKSDTKLFMLRNVDKDHIRTLDDLKGIICEQFGEDVVSQDLKFDCGYYRSNKKIWVRNDDDFEEILRLLGSSKDVTLWCMGIPSKSGKRQRSSSI